MPHFGYTARHPTKGKVSGTIEADSRISAIRQVERLGCTPISVRPHQAEPATPRPLRYRTGRYSCPKCSEPLERTSWLRRQLSGFCACSKRGCTIDVLREEFRKAQDSPEGIPAELKPLIAL